MGEPILIFESSPLINMCGFSCHSIDRVLIVAHQLERMGVFRFGRLSITALRASFSAFTKSIPLPILVLLS